MPSDLKPNNVVTVRAEVVTYGKLISRLGGPILPGFEHAVTSRSETVKPDIPGLLPAVLLGDRAAEPGHIDAAEPAGESPDGALLVTRKASLACFDGRPGIALMRFRFRPERGEDRGGRRYLQACIWLVAYDDWRRHPAEILSCAGARLRAEPDLADETLEQRFRRPQIELDLTGRPAPSPGEVIKNRPDGIDEAMAQAAFAGMVNNLLGPDNGPAEFGGKVFAREAAFLYIAGHALEAVYGLDPRGRHDFSLSARLRLAGEDRRLAYLPAQMSVPEPVDWPAFMSRIWRRPVPATPPSRAAPERPRAKAPSFELKPRSAPAAESRAAPAEVSLDPIGDTMLAHWEQKFAAFAAVEGDRHETLALIREAYRLSGHVKKFGWKRLDAGRFADSRHATWNSLRLFLAIWGVAEFRNDFSLSEILAIGRLIDPIIKTLAVHSPGGPPSDIEKFYKRFCDFVAERVAALTVLWPVECEVFLSAALSKVQKDLLRYDEIGEALRASWTFNAHWKDGKPSLTLQRGERDRNGLLGTACRLLIQRSGGDDPVCSPPKRRGMPMLSELSLLDRDCEYDNMQEYFDAISYCKQYSLGRERLSDPHMSAR
jgi:hypothetical protein